MKRLMKSLLVLVCILSLVLTAVACNGKKNENANNESTNKNPLQLATLHAMLELAGYTEGVEALENYFVNGETVAMLPSVNADGNNDKVNDGNNGNGNDKKVTVEDAYVDENGDLNVELSNGNSVNAGGLSDEHKENNGNHYGQDKHNKETHIGHNGNWWVDGEDTGIPAKGNDGADGVGIVSIAKQSTEGLVDTYVITLSNGRTFSFTVTNARSIVKTELDADGCLHIYYNDGTEDNVGKITGEDGKDGEDGAGIKNMYIDENGHLIVVLTDDRIIDCGNMPGNTGGENVGEHTHVYGEWMVTEFPTCEELGSSARKCLSCEKIEVKILSETGHNYVNRICSVCGAVSQESSIGLSFKISDDGTYYIVAGIGGCSDSNVIIPEVHQGLPVKAIASNAFCNCRTITSVVIPDSVTTIGPAAVFKNCPNLKKIYIGKGVSDMPFNVFYMATAIVSIDVDPDNNYFKSIDGNLYTKDGETLIKYAVGKQDNKFIIPENVTSIGTSAFLNSRYLEGIVIHSNVKSIGSSAFNGCTLLTSVVIPEGVTSIGDNAFYRCSSLTDVYYTGTAEEWAEISVGNNNSPLTSATKHYNYVPAE